ncbi:MAG TPA: VWA domain-containing protein, partial [Myxococcales bacterium]|nr:VWA domain-containing protein [Myxococcales bacterium]
MPLFQSLRDHGVRVTTHEWLALMEALDKGVVAPNLVHFYYTARALLVKRESDFDRFDQAFIQVFGGIDTSHVDLDPIMDWLEKAQKMKEFSPEMLAALESMDLESLRDLFEQRLKEQTERHDGGNKWIGTGGTSPFGHGGRHPSGIRMGGAGGSRSAMQIASRRHFENYRDDMVLDVRQMQVALRKLRRLTRKGVNDELDMDETINKTGRNAGDLTLIFRPPRKNQVRLVLMMDAGGSMTPFARLVSQLFTAASKAGHWKSFDAYYFHNCVYESAWNDIQMRTEISTTEIIKKANENSVLVMIGDASMHPGELNQKYGSIDYWHRNETTGIEWLRRIKNAFPTSVWLNPMPERWWNAPSLIMIKNLFT